MTVSFFAPVKTGLQNKSMTSSKNTWNMVQKENSYFVVGEEVVLRRMARPNEQWIMLACVIGSIGVLLAMFIHAHNVPVNYFLLAVWTVMQALTVASIVTFYDLEIVIQAFLVTVGVVGSLFVYSMQSKRDWSKGYALLASISVAFIFGTLLQIILMSSAFNFFMSIFGAALFSVYLVFDIDMVMMYHSEEDYIVACVMIYMDVINLFLNILRIVAEAQRS